MKPSKSSPRIHGPLELLAQEASAAAGRSSTSTGRG